MRITLSIFLSTFLSLIGCSNTNELNSKTSIDASGDKGSIVLTGKFVNNLFDGKYIKLYETEGYDMFLLDSAIVEDHNFVFKLKKIKTGNYKLGWSSNRNNARDIILNPSEKNVTINFIGNSITNGIKSENSPENIGLEAYAEIKKKHNEKSQRVRRNRNMSYPDKKARIDIMRTLLKEKEDSLSGVYPQTFFSKTVSKYQSQNKLNKNTYWNDIDFNDESLIRSTVINDRLVEYIQTHCERKKGSDPLVDYYNVVDLIAGIIKERGNDKVLEYVLYTLSASFYSSNMEEVSMYVIDNYFYGDACGDAEISKLFKQKAAGIKSLQEGNIPPDFSITTIKNEKITFSAVAAKNKLTLVLFWASFCHHCQQEMPFIKEYYTKYHDKGFEIIGVSVDSDKNLWSKAVEEFDMTWHSAAELSGWQSGTPQAFRVSSTPILFLVDSDRKLLLKTDSANELGEFLKTYNF